MAAADLSVEWVGVALEVPLFVWVIALTLGWRQLRRDLHTTWEVYRALRRSTHESPPERHELP